MDGQFLISEDKKVHRSTEEIMPDEKDWWSLDNGVYEIVMENIVSVEEGYAGFVITRSTLNRNGVFITSGLYDSGYHGVMAGALHVRGGKTFIKKGTRVGQFIMFEAETLSLYDGSDFIQLSESQTQEFSASYGGFKILLYKKKARIFGSTVSITEQEHRKNRCTRLLHCSVIQ